MPAISDVQLGKPTIYANGFGDTWDPAWAADGKLYCAGNDGSGWEKACSSNVFFNVIEGDDPAQLTGKTVNGMGEYGGWAEQGSDGCTWKTSGTLALDGALYLVVGRHSYGTKSGDPHQRQTARRASIIRSTDGGRTWQRSAAENYEQPMFPSGRFATPYFIHYGQEGSTPAVDGADRYVYAVSNNGFWCNGDDYILGRVARERIANLDAADWEYYSGGDGMNDASWSRSMDDAQLLISDPLKCGETGATYLPHLDRYILVAWYYPGNPNIETQETHFIYYEAPKPWGPWKMVKEDVIFPHGWYCPRVLSWRQQASGDTLEAVIVTGGDYYDFEKYYRFTTVPLTIKTGAPFPAQPLTPAPQVVRSSAAGDGPQQFRYIGQWEMDRTREKASGGQEMASSNPGDSFTLPFTGSRLRWFASNDRHLGIAAVSIDGGPETLVDLWTYCHVPQYGRLVYESAPLAPGPHTFSVRVTGQKHEKSEGTAVFHDRVETFE